MFRRILTVLLSLGLLIGFAAVCQADTYKLVNKTGHALKVQSKAMKFVHPAEMKPAFFEMQSGENKTVDFGNEFRLWFIHIYNKDDMSQNHYWDRRPQPTDPNKNWTLTITIKNNEMEVTTTEN